MSEATQTTDQFRPEIVYLRGRKDGVSGAGYWFQEEFNRWVGPFKSKSHALGYIHKIGPME